MASAKFDLYSDLPRTPPPPAHAHITYRIIRDPLLNDTYRQQNINYHSENSSTHHISITTSHAHFDATRG